MQLFKQRNYIYNSAAYVKDFENTQFFETFSSLNSKCNYFFDKCEKIYWRLEQKRAEGKDAVCANDSAGLLKNKDKNLLKNKYKNCFLH